VIAKVKTRGELFYLLVHGEIGAQMFILWQFTIALLTIPLCFLCCRYMKKFRQNPVSVMVYFAILTWTLSVNIGTICWIINGFVDIPSWHAHICQMLKIYSEVFFIALFLKLNERKE
jgi:hypothetical protein